MSSVIRRQHRSPYRSGVAARVYWITRFELPDLLRERLSVGFRQDAEHLVAGGRKALNGHPAILHGYDFRVLNRNRSLLFYRVCGDFHVLPRFLIAVLLPSLPKLDMRLDYRNRVLSWETEDAFTASKLGFFRALRGLRRTFNLHLRRIV